MNVAAICDVAACILVIFAYFLEEFTFIILIMEAVSCSETSVSICHTTRCYDPLVIYVLYSTRLVT
jgi:hypothetical protein